MRVVHRQQACRERIRHVSVVMKPTFCFLHKSSQVKSSQGCVQRLSDPAMLAQGP